MPIHRTQRLGPPGGRYRSGANVVLLALLLVLLSGCTTGPTPAVPREPLAAARVGSPALAPSVAAPATDAPEPTPSPHATFTRVPTQTPRPSGTPAPTLTATPTRVPPTATASPTPTDEPSPTPTLPVFDAAYVADVSIPDGTAIEPGTPFTKTWRLRNTGNVPWDETTSLTLAVGEAMGAPEAVPVPATAPGETADVSVPMVAPAAVGEHGAAWRLCRAEGCFGGAVTLQIVSRSALAARGPAVELPPAEPAACNYTGNRNPTSMKFHRADCRWVKEMYEGNKVCFATREEAVAAGYVPCKVCGP